MFVGATDKLYIAALGTLVAYIYVGREISASKVPDVYRAISIW